MTEYLYPVSLLRTVNLDHSSVTAESNLVKMDYFKYIKTQNILSKVRGKTKLLVMKSRYLTCENEKVTGHIPFTAQREI